MRVTPVRRGRSLVLAPLFVAGLLLGTAACGDDDGATVGAPTDADATASVATEADLDGRTFVSTTVEGWTLVEGSEITLTFDAGSLSAQAGCNTMRGGFQLEEGALQVDELAQTMMGCEDDLQAQDEWLAGFLGASPEATLAGDDLVLHSGDATITATDRG